MLGTKNEIIEIIESNDDAIRNRSLDSVCRNASLDELLSHAATLDTFWRSTENLYDRVRALFFLSAIHRYYVPLHLEAQPIDLAAPLIPFESYQHLLARRFVEAIDDLLECQDANGASDGLSSALAEAYKDLAFQTLANQVRKSVRTVRGNQWMFRTGHPADHPLRIRKELLSKADDGAYPILRETTSVRMDFSHSGWSDIFFLGMDFPAGAQVINASVNLGVHNRDAQPTPPIETYLRVIDEPVLRLVSVDLKAHAVVRTIAEVFDFAADYLGLVKAAVIAAGIVPPGMEGCDQSIQDVLSRIVGPNLGLEIVSKVNDIPKGSRLAVSTNLLGSLISICMRATGQVTSLEGGCDEADRRIIAARAILGEWIGGSGGGWQDSGGVWPGIKLITGAEAQEEDPEAGISRGRLLPQHTVFSEEEVSAETRAKLQNSLVLVHGGMAQNVGPILEMVTEKYLLRSPQEWEARKDAIRILQDIRTALRTGDIRRVGQLTHENFFGPLQTIIPWCTNRYTQELVELAQAKYGEQFWGFWMLGGMAGGGMGFIFDPAIKPEAQEWMQEVMSATKIRMQTRLPFAMDPVVYDFEINDKGTWSELRHGKAARMPDEYYALLVPTWLQTARRNLSPLFRRELERLGEDMRDDSESRRRQTLIESVFPTTQSAAEATNSLDELLAQFGFDRHLHEQVRTDLRSGRYGLAQNRLSANTSIQNVDAADITDARRGDLRQYRQAGEKLISEGQVAVLTLAAGIGSRWTEGAGVVKGLHPFCQLNGRHRSFLEVHLAKSRKVGQAYGSFMPHIITTGYMTHQPIADYLRHVENHHYPGQVLLSEGRYVGLRMVPMVRDLQFAWEEMPQQMLDEQQQKVRDSLRTALMSWARQTGEATDYRDNMPMQCLHPVGHWYEIPNLLRNGTLANLLDQQPQLNYLMLHNVDTLGATVDPCMLGYHQNSGGALTFEVIGRRLEDRGGGLAKVNGRVRLLEGLAMPREKDEFKLSYYNSMTTWISIDKLLKTFGLVRADLRNTDKVDHAIRELAQRMPTYITLKDVKKRWGHGQEDVFPVSQFEKLWSDMTALPEVDCRFVVVPMVRGQQMKHQAQLDGWVRDGSAKYVEQLCQWS